MSNIFFGKTNFDCRQAVFEKLAQNYNNFSNQLHIIIVPDRISVLTEIEIFKHLKIESTSNIQVMTLSRLSSKILDNISVISKTSSCMIFQKLIKENKKDLKCFNKNIGPDLACELYSTVSQFKSCKIDFNNVCATTKNKILADKLNDISLIYKKYQEYLALNNLYDATDRLDILANNIKNCDFVSNSFFYVLNFDGFTFQGYQIISNIIKFCKQFNIGIACSDNPQNEHIYNSDYVNRILKLFEINNIKPNINYCKEFNIKEFKHLQDNLFGFDPLVMKIDNLEKINLFEACNIEEELKFVCSEIKNLIINSNIKFNEIALCVCDLQNNCDIVERVLQEYNFNYYIDLPKSFYESILSKFVVDIIETFQNNFAKVNVLSLLKNLLSNNFDDEKIANFEDYLNKYSINDYYTLKSTNIDKYKYFSDFNEVRQFVVNMYGSAYECIIKKDSDCKTFNDFVDLFSGLLLNLNVLEKISNISQKFYKNGQIKKSKYFEQYYNLLTSVFENIKFILGYEKCDLNMFNLTLTCGLKLTDVSTTPLSTNSIFVGDNSQSFFDKVKVLFVVNASENQFPKKIDESGIISDKEILELSDSYILEPSIIEINKKERFKSFEIVLDATEKLFLSYNFEKASTQASKVMQDVSKMFSIIDSYNNFMPLPFKNYSDIEFLTKNNNYLTAKHNLISSIRSYLDGHIEDEQKLIVLQKAVNLNKNQLENFNFKNHLKINNNIFFLKNNVSVSQVERYMTCPFLHFCDYGLGLKNKENADLDNLIIGTIFHSFAQKIFINYKLPIEENNINDVAIKVFNNIIEDERYSGVVLNSFNKALIDNLRVEAVRFLRVLNYQSANSKFKPSYFEAYFDKSNKIKGIEFKINNKIIKLVGQVDRVDIFENYFRIIDYKTGKCDKSLKELFFGKKVQLEAYLFVVKNSLKMKPAGAYYLPIKSGFATKNKNFYENYKLKGKTLELDSVLFASDKRLETNESFASDIIDAGFEVDKKNQKFLTKKSKVISNKILERLSLYAINLIEKACLDIEMLNITPSPLVLSSSDDPCKNCEYFGLCRFDEYFDNFKRVQNAKITEENFEME